jgi:predicted Zn-dependent peptidase
MKNTGNNIQTENNNIKRYTTEKLVLENGITLLLEPVDFFETVSVGVWINSGSKDETKEENGYAHLIEHMLFKGTDTRNALELSKEIDRVGGYMNAFTTREYTCFYVNMVSKHINVGIDVLADMILNSKFDQTELEREKQVIIEEIRMYDDAPDQLVHDLFIENIWRGNPVGRPILGTVKNIKSVSRDKVMGFYESNYFGDNVIVSVAGRYNRQNVIDKISSIKFKNQLREKKAYIPKNLHYDLKYKEKGIEQVYFCYGFNGLSKIDEKRYKLFVFSTLFGGGTSSRLYQKIRETLGLCYSIYSFNASFMNDGVFGIYSVTNPENFEKLFNEVRNEASDILSGNITEEELFIAKEQIKGNIIFSKESLEARMNRNAKNEMIFGREITYQEAIENIEAVTVEDIKEIGSYLFLDSKRSLFSVCPKGYGKKLENLTI